MYELIQVGESTYYIASPVKIGVFVDEDKNAYLIDSGNDQSIGKKIEKIIKENGWHLKTIINTHSHADHTGGNNLLQKRQGCTILSTSIENAFIEKPIMEPSFLYGGFPCKELRNKFLMAQRSISSDIEKAELPEGINYIELAGHSSGMVGIKTQDDIYFIADALVGENILNKYHISYIFDVKAYLETLDQMEHVNAKLFIPAHADATEDIKPLVVANRNKVYEIMKIIIELTVTPISFEDILKLIFDHYNLKMDINQYVLVGSTIRSYISFLSDEGRLEMSFEENKMLWISTNK